MCHVSYFYTKANTTLLYFENSRFILRKRFYETDKSILQASGKTVTLKLFILILAAIFEY